MAIVSSVIARNETQADGRRYITEAHTTNDIGVLLFTYLAAAGVNETTVMNARATAYNAALAAVPTVTVTMDDGTTATIRTYDFSDLDMRLTAGQRTALQTAKAVIDAIRPLLRIYASLTPAQQAFVLAHNSWFAAVLAVVNG